MADKDLCSLELGDIPGGDRAEIVAYGMRIFDKNKYSGNARQATELEIEAFEKALEVAKLVEKRNHYLNVVAKNNMVDYVKSNFDKDMSEGFRTYFLGSQYNKIGARNHVTNTMSTYVNKYRNTLRQRLIGEGLVKLARSGTLDEEVAVIIDAMETGKTLGKHSPEALALAKVYDDVNKQIRADANRAGANIADLPGYLFRRGHRSTLIRNKRDSWLSFMKTRLNWEKMGFPSEALMKVMPAEEVAAIAARQDKLLNEQYMEFASGAHISSSISPSTSGLKGFASIAKRMSKERVFFFKDPKDEIAYAKEFGYQTIFENMLANIDQKGRQVGIMDRVGPNAEMNIDAAVTSILKEMKTKADPKDVAKMAKLSDYMRGRFKQDVLPFVTGSNLINTDNFWDNTTAINAGIQRWSLLGGSGLVSFIVDPFVKSFSAYRRSGEFGYAMNEYFNTFTFMFKNLDNPAVQDLLADLGATNDHMLKTYNPRFSDNGISMSRPQEVVGQIDNFFFYANGQYFVDTRNRAQSTIGISLFLGRQSNKKYDQLSVEARDVLNKHAIDATEWDAIRKSTGDYQGSKVIKTAKLLDLDEGEVAAILSARGEKPTTYKINKFKNDLRTKTQGLFNDESNYSILSADERVRSLMFGGERGTFKSFFWKSALQFKNYPFAYIQRILNREIYDGNQSKGKMIANLAGAIALTTIGGYITLNVDALRRGQEPKEFGPMTIADSMIRGGGLGIYSDFLYTLLQDRYGVSSLERTLGPTAGDTVMFGKILSGIAQGDGDKTLDNTANLLMKNLPGSNIFWLKPILDYAVINQMNEMISPGSLARSEQRLQKDYGQEYFMLKPSETMLFN